MRVRDEGVGALGDPLLRAGGTFGQFPLEGEQVFEEVDAPFGGRPGPGDFQAAGNRISAAASSEAVSPAEALLFEAGRFRLWRDVSGRGGAVCFAERVAAGDEGDGLLIIHRHAAEGFADIEGRLE